MIALRHHLRRHRLLAAWLAAAALLMKLLVPSGYMPLVSDGSITIELCSGYGPRKMAEAMPGMAHHFDKEGQHGEVEMPCAFLGLSAASLAAVDPLLLALAIAFIIAVTFRVATASPVRARPFLRPPLRGPPASLSIR